MILKGLSFQALALVAVGSILGYVAATADMSNPALAARGSGEPISAPVASAGEGASCSTGLGCGPQLALAERGESVASTTAQAGVKPNILVIFGDESASPTSAPTATA
jgi:arylsulfatase